jgi:hypothetical protein
MDVAGKIPDAEWREPVEGNRDGTSGQVSSEVFLVVWTMSLSSLITCQCWFLIGCGDGESRVLTWPQNGLNPGHRLRRSFTSKWHQFLALTTVKRSRNQAVYGAALQ